MVGFENNIIRWEKRKKKKKKGELNWEK